MTDNAITYMKKLYKTPYLEVLYEALQEAILDGSGDGGREEYGEPINFDW